MINRFDPENIVTVDFETLFDTKKKKLGFRHQSTEQYIRDPRWLTHGVGIKKGFNKTVWLYGADKVAAFFDKIDFHSSTMLAHNAKFDGLVLSHHYNVRPLHWIDTQSLAGMVHGNNLKSASLDNLTRLHLPGEVKDQTALFNIEGKTKLTPEEILELGIYCRGDCDKTHMLYCQFLRMMKDEAIDFNLLTVDLVTKMFTDPVLRLDPDPLVDVIAIEESEKQAALDLSVATSFKQLNSGPQLATLLESHGVEPPMKISVDTGKETYAFAKTDRPFVELLEHDDEVIRNLVAARLRVKTSINETRAKKYLDVSVRGGAWPVDLVLSGARTTHRLSGASGGGGNPQNLGRGSHLRYAVIPPEGFQMYAVDSSNIELRDAMVLAGEWDIVKKLHNPEFDLYKLFAAHLYSKDVGDVNKAERLVGKIAMLQLQYGAGWEGFMNAAYNWGVTLEPEEAMRIVAMYRAAFPKMPQVWRAINFMLKQLIRGEAEQWGNDHIVYANPMTSAGCAGFTSVRTGLSITYPNLRWERNEDGKREMVYSRYDKKTRRLMDTRIWGAKAFENICQMAARDVVFEQQLTLDQHLKDEYDPACRTVMSIHDESVGLVPNHVPMKAVLADAERIFGTSPSWWPELPVFGEANAGDTYAECK